MSSLEQPAFDVGYLHDHSRLSRFRAEDTADSTFTSNGRTPVLSLDGSWHFSPDPLDSGLRGEWYLEHEEDNLVVGPPDVDFASWDTVSVPGCWNTQRQELFYYEGSAWYMRDFELAHPQANDQLFLHFDGVGGETLVFVNQSFAGYSSSPSLPFAFDISSLIKSGENRIVVWVSNRRRSDAVPGEFFDWFNYGGIFRSVSIYSVPQKRIAEYWVGLDQSDSPALEATLTPATPGEVICTIGGHRQILQADSNGRIKGNLDFRPELWDTDRPVLYPLRISFGSDSIEDKIGFRSLKVEGCTLFLNGKPLYLKGVAVHEETEADGRSLTDEDRMTMLRDARTMGANTLRLAHYPHHTKTAQLADEIGILLWEEIPVYWHLDFSNPDTVRQAGQQLKTLIKRDRNRASVALWSIGNENPDSDDRLQFMCRLAQTARELDPTRPITAACLVNVGEYRIEDRLADTVDLVGVNEYYGWYYHGQEHVDRLVKSRPDKPIIISEFGAGAVFLHGSRPAPKWSEEYQADLYAEQFAALRNLPNLAGTFPWLLYDFRSPRRLNKYQKGINRKGLITIDRRHRKLGYFQVQKEYGSGG